MQRVAVVIGGARCVWDDVREFSAMLSDANVHADWIAVNDIGTVWSGHLVAWCTLHPEKLADWVERRRIRGYADPDALYSHAMVGQVWGSQQAPPATRISDYRFPERHPLYPDWRCEENASGSSGLYAVKVALIDMGYTGVVLCGVPMDADQRHYFGGDLWHEVSNFRNAWHSNGPWIGDNVRSMSGWTRELLGAPTRVELKLWDAAKAPAETAE